MVEGMTERWITHPPPGIQIQAMPLKVGNVSLFSCFIVGRSFSFLFVWPHFSDKSLSIPKTQDVRIGKVIHCYPVRMRNPPSVVWLDRIGNMALVVQVLHRRRFLSDWKAVLSAGLDRHLLVPFGRRHFPVQTLRVVRAAQVNGDGNFQSGPLFFVVVVVKDARTVSQWFWRAINCFSSYWLVSAVLSWSFVVLLTRSTFETGINRLVLYFISESL